MGNYVSEQLAVFLRAIALGAVLGLIYDLLYTLRKLGKNLWGALLDAAFCIIAAVSIFLFVMAGDGEMRTFIILGALGGALLFRCLLGSLLKPVWTFWLDFVLLPVDSLKNFLKNCGLKAKKVFSFCRNWFTMKSTSLRRRKKNRVQEGDDTMSKPARNKKARPAQKKPRRSKIQARPTNRLTILLLVTLMLGIGLQIYQMFGQLQSARAEEQVYVQRLAELKETNAQLQQDLDNSGSMDLIEDIARDKLGMVKEGEKIFHFSK